MEKAAQSSVSHSLLGLPSTLSTVGHSVCGNSIISFFFQPFLSSSDDATAIVYHARVTLDLMKENLLVPGKIA
jgi:hypothetical protein